MILIRRFFIGILFLVFSASAYAFFPEGTPIIFKDKATPIEAIHKGQYVLGLHTKTGKRWTYPVTQTLTATAKELVVLTVGKETIEATPEQLFLTNSGKWVEAGHLRISDSLVNDKGIPLAVMQVERKREKRKVYHFEVGEAHTFFVGEARVLAHNPNTHTIAIAEAIQDSGAGVSPTIAKLIAEYTPTIRIKHGTGVKALVNLEYFSDPSDDRFELRIHVFLEGNRGMEQNCHGYACNVRGWIYNEDMTQALLNKHFFQKLPGPIHAKTGDIIAWKKNATGTQTLEYEHTAIYTGGGGTSGSVASVKQMAGILLELQEPSLTKAWGHTKFDAFRPQLRITLPDD